MTFTSTRSKSTLLIPSKRFLSPPRTPTSTTNPLTPSYQPTLQIRSTEDEHGKAQKQRSEQRRVEVDFSAAPQPFLDPGLWEKMKSKKSTGAGVGV
ncbi:hypothetical protein BJY01DRAFT_215620 [Aspergillus pseudoustus]|uniref:Uncharacterized protein n=1 Tax=Aspergillus pseudoustus TaxID=1810923 RepID=A0ABR4JWR3_9EURO